MIASNRTVCCSCGESVDPHWGKAFRSILHDQPYLASWGNPAIPGQGCNCTIRPPHSNAHVRLLCTVCFDQNYEMTPDGAIITYTEEWERYEAGEITASEAIEIQEEKP